MSWKDLEGVSARNKAFEEEHRDGIMDESGTWVLYPDGAYREVSPHGLMSDGPRDPYKRHQRIVRYHEVKLKRLTNEFYRYRRQLMSLGHSIMQTNMGNISDQAVERLRRLQASVQNQKKALEAAKADLDANTPAQIKRERAMAGTTREYAQQQLGKIQAIEV